MRCWENLVHDEVVRIWKLDFHVFDMTDIVGENVRESRGRDIMEG